MTCGGGHLGFQIITKKHKLNKRPKYRNIFFSEAIALIEPKLCINHWKVLYKLCVVYVDRNSKMTTTAGHSSYIGPIVCFSSKILRKIRGFFRAKFLKIKGLFLGILGLF
jgi:hypothetical protein